MSPRRSLGPTSSSIDLPWREPRPRACRTDGSSEGLAPSATCGNEARPQWAAAGEVTTEGLNSCVGVTAEGLNSCVA